MKTTAQLFDECFATVQNDGKMKLDMSFALADKIDMILREKNISQKQLAEKMGETNAEVSRWLAGTQFHSTDYRKDFRYTWCQTFNHSVMKSKTSNYDDKIMHCTTFDELIDVEYGKSGTIESVNSSMLTPQFSAWPKPLKNKLSMLVMIILYR